MNFSVSCDCDKNTKPEGASKGAYYIVKRNVIKSFSFNTQAEGESAFLAMREFLASRKDADKLKVQLV